MASGGRFSYDAQQDGDILRIFIYGDISEDAEFQQITEAARSLVHIDLAGVRSINSTGVREWIRFIRRLAEASVDFVMDRCAVPVVHQLNHIANFKGHGTVKSIQVPYYCPDCDMVYTDIADVPVDPDGLDVLKTCDQCGGPMQFDDIPHAYLAFQRW